MFGRATIGGLDFSKLVPLPAPDQPEISFDRASIMLDYNGHVWLYYGKNTPLPADVLELHKEKAVNQHSSAYTQSI